MLPLEVTTHNLYFHEQSSIFSLDSHLDLLCTGGGDGIVRLWRVNTKNITTFKYCTALDSSTKIEYISDIHTHNKTVNCVRFNNQGDLASCSDGGRVMVTLKKINNLIESKDDEELNNNSNNSNNNSNNSNNNSTSISSKSTFSIRSQDGVDIFDLIWTNDFLIIGTSLGTVEVYSIENQFKKIPSRKVHTDIIQSQAYSPHHNLLVTASKDNSSWLIQINEEITPLERLEKFFSTTRGFYRRLSFSRDGKFLYLVSCKGNMLVVLSYPFREEHVYCKIGPLDSEVIRVVESNDHVYVVTKKSVYIFSKNWELKTCVENITFKSTTDGTYCCGILFVSSLDGFISSIKLGEKW